MKEFQKVMNIINVYSSNSKDLDQTERRGRVVTLLLRILEVPGKVLARRLVNLTEVFYAFPHFLQANVGIVL
jgi:hypothetical protein